MKNYQKNPLKLIKISELILAILLFFTLSSLGGKQIAVVYLHKVYILFPELQSELDKIEKQIYQKRKELYNIPKSLELKFITEIENYYQNLLNQRNKLQKELENKIIKSQSVGLELKQKIENLKKQTETKIYLQKQITEKKLYQLENEIYHFIKLELKNLKDNYQKKVDLEVEKQIYESKQKIQNYRQQIKEIYKNQIINLNLKISNTSLYDPEREEAIQTIQQIKQKQDELLQNKINQIESELYKQINNIPLIYEKEYLEQSKKIIEKYQNEFKYKHLQITSQYQKFIHKLQSDYEKNISNLLKQYNTNINKELYDSYTKEISKLQHNFESIKKNLSKKYDQILFDKITQINMEIDTLIQKKESIHYQLMNNIFNIATEVAKEKNVSYLFVDPIYASMYVDITDECIKKIKEIKNKTK